MWLTALAAILRDVLSPVGSSDSGRATGLATLARSPVCGPSEISSCDQNQGVVRGRGFWRRGAVGVS